MDRWWLLALASWLLPIGHCLLLPSALRYFEQTGAQRNSTLRAGYGRKGWIGAISWVAPTWLFDAGATRVLRGQAYGMRSMAGIDARPPTCGGTGGHAKGDVVVTQREQNDDSRVCGPRRPAHCARNIRTTEVLRPARPSIPLRAKRIISRVDLLHLLLGKFPKLCTEAGDFIRVIQLRDFVIRGGDLVSARPGGNMQDFPR
jgi:hypothetical protein